MCAALLPLWWQRLPFSVVAGLLTVRAFILYHDHKLILEKDPNIIDYFFKGKDFAVHKIINLTLDIIFTLSPYNKDDPDRRTPIYLLSTDISNIRLCFETEMILDMTNMLDYFALFKNSKFEYVSLT